MKKYYFKGTNQEIKLGDKITQIITCSNGSQFECNSLVDEATIEDLLKRDSIEVKIVTPVQKKIVKKHKVHKKIVTPKDENPRVKVIHINSPEEFSSFINSIFNVLDGKC